MSFQSYGEAKKKENVEVSEIPPTVMIGLGGTGKEVLLRVRQLLFEKYGVASLPTIKYLWIDTDIRDHNIDGKSLDYISEEVKFQESEKIDCQIKGDEFLKLQERKNENQHIFQWFDGRLFRLGSVMNGARQIRQLGRLAFWHHAFKGNDIRRKIGQAVEDIGSAASINELQEKFGINCTGERKFILVFSFAGGTGSGMFMDTAFLIRKVFKSHNPDIVGYAVLPSVFSPDPHNAQKIYANAYAALKELEYFSMRKDFSADPEKVNQTGQITTNIDNTVSAHDFNANWNNLGEDFIPGPPFNTCYLIDNKTDAGGSITPKHKTDLCDMIAENIFLDYSTQGFSNKKRTVRSNLDDFLTKELKYEYKDVIGGNTKVIHSELFSRRFSAFGLNKIYIPVERIRQACTYKLLSDILAQMTKINEPEADIQKIIKENVLEPLMLRVQAGNDDFLRNLQVADDMGNSFLQLIDQHWINTQRPKLLQLVRNKEKGLARRLESAIVEFRRSNLNEPRDPHDWGHYIKRIRKTNKNAFLKAVKGKILEAVAGWVDNPHIRIDLATDYLQELNRTIAKHQKFFEKNFNRFRSQEKALFEQVRTLQILVEEEENGWLYHGWALKAIIELICSLIAQHFRQAVMANIFSTAAEVCAELQDFIGTSYQEEKNGEMRTIRRGLIQQVWGLKEDLIEMKNIFDQRLHSFDQVDQHQIFENLYKTEQLQNFYYLQDSEGNKLPVDLEQVFRFEKQLLDFIGIKHTFDLIKVKESIGLGNIIEKLEVYGQTRFQKVQFEVDAIKEMYQRFSKNRTQLNEKIRHFIQYGKVWLRKGATAAVTQAITKDYAEQVEVGINREMLIKHEYHQEFEKAVRNQILASGFKGNLADTVDVAKDVAYFYNEYAGLPLMYIGNLEDYKAAYIQEALQGGTLHLDWHNDHFSDILIKETKEVKDILRIIQVLLNGIILRVIDLKFNQEIGGTESYVYKDMSKMIQAQHPLGERNIAIEYLRNDLQLLEEIEIKIARLKDKLSDKQYIQYFMILLSYQTAAEWHEGIAEGPFPARYISIAGQQIEKFSPEYRAIRSLINDLAVQLKSQGWDLPKKLNEQFIKDYKEKRLDEYAEKVLVRGKTYRIFKESQLAEILNKI